MSRSSICLVAVLAACGPHAPHSVAQGDECDYDRDCALVEGAIVHCPCGTCELTYSLPIACGAEAIVCKPDEICSSRGGPQGGCIPAMRLGESCALTHCLPDLFCGSGQICRTPAEVGGSCTASDEASCAAPAFCDAATARCVPPGGAGAPCDSTRIYRDECQEGTACSIVSNTCVPRLENGEACTDNAGCLSDFCTRDGECQTRSC